MIRLEIKGCCNECEDIDLKLDFFWYGPEKVYQLRCSHENVCGKLKEECRRALENRPAPEGG